MTVQTGGDGLTFVHSLLLSRAKVWHLGGNTGIWKLKPCCGQLTLLDYTDPCLILSNGVSSNKLSQPKENSFFCLMINTAKEQRPLFF